MFCRTQKLVKIPGKINSVIREIYLRNDVQCHSPLCDKCELKEDSVSNFLCSDATHYAIPDYDVLHKFWDIFEISEIQGLLFLQTIASKILHTDGRSRYRKLLQLSRDKQKGCAIFLNEICADTYCQRLNSMLEEEWTSSCIIKVAEYYQQHLNKALPLMIITEQKEVYKKLKPNSEIFLISLKDYLETMYNPLKFALELYESISAVSLLSNDKETSKVYSSYLPRELLESGIKTGKYIRGNLHVNKHISSQEAFVTASKTTSKDSSDYLIYGLKDRNRSIHGDDVVVELLPRNEWKSRCRNLVMDSNINENVDHSESEQTVPTCRVVGVLDRRWRDYVASFPEENNKGSSVGTQKILVTPYDYRIPKIRLATKQAESLQNKRIVVRIDNWDKDSQYPNGHFVRTLGEIGFLETEVQSLLVEHNIQTSEFSPSLISELPTSTEESPWVMDESEVRRRKDLRNSHLIFSIDPKSSMDVDDALSVRQLQNGMWELGVHIADVTYFLSQFSNTDLEAQSRSTSVYLPDRRYEMLPRILSENLCSLLGNVDRYAVSVLWKLDENFEVKHVWYGRTVIRSSYKLCYEDAEDIYLGCCSAKKLQKNITEFQKLSDGDLCDRLSELKLAINNLVQVSTALRNKRLAVGGLELNSINMKFEIDKTLPSVITGLKQEKELVMHKTIAECMIFANHWVAKKIVQAFPQLAVLRHHPPPRHEDLECLPKLANSRGFLFNIQTNKDLAQSLEAAMDPCDSAVNQIFRILTTRAMNEATYFCAGTTSPGDYFHYGLGIDLYTHFTSPIRRYSDVMVHRLLLQSVSKESKPLVLKMSETEEMCSHMNEKHRAAQHIEKSVQEVFQAFYFGDIASKQDSEGCLADAVIYSIKNNGFLVFVPQYGFKGAVYLCNKEKKVAFVSDSVSWVDGKLVLSENSLVVKTVDSTQTYSVFDHVTVLIKVEKPKAHHPKICVELINNKPYLSTVSDVSNQLQNPAKVIKPVSDGTLFNDRISSPEKIQLSFSDGKRSLYYLLKDFKQMTLLPPTPT